LTFEDGSQVLNRSKLHAVPLYDSVSAGLGTLALDDAIEHIPLYIDNAEEAKRTFCVNVKGNSMSPKIEDGDIIQIVKQDTVDVGKIAVVLIDGTEAVVKQVVYTDESVELRSFNPFFPSRFFKKEEIDRIKIVGVVKKIIKSV
jgi:repressor LexA